MTKYSKEEFCPVSHYRCLMPVTYELIKEGTVKTYKKSKVDCPYAKRGECNKETECQHFMAAKDIIEE